MVQRDERVSGAGDAPGAGQPRPARPRVRMALAAAIAAAALLAGAGAAQAQAPSGAPQAATDQDGFQEEFNLAGRRLAATGESRYWILKPGYQAVFESEDTTLTIRVLDETKEVAGVLTRVVEEREEKDGQLHEVARNFYAIDPATGDVFYFGEEVDFYENGRIVDHAGSWLAGGANRPGLIMAGAPRVGAKYYQELAPGAAQDRAEVLSTTERCTVPAGTFEGCLVTRETTPLEPSVVEEKAYAPGVGLVRDKDLRLVRFGYGAAPAPAAAAPAVSAPAPAAAPPAQAGPAGGVTPEQARAAALAAVPGTVLEVEPDVKQGRAAYEVEIRLSDGRIVEAVVDASTGAVVASGLEDGDGWPRVRRGRADD